MILLLITYKQVFDLTFELIYSLKTNIFSNFPRDTGYE